ncbi:hypothetical protein GmHk_17G047957 [Glycine max]|nr:hypothetical protein GmHk_17G047957 [Glycine max]
MSTATSGTSLVFAKNRVFLSLIPTIQTCDWLSLDGNTQARIANLPNFITETGFTCRYLGENAQLKVIKNAGHSLSVEKPKEMYKNIKCFLMDPTTPTVQKKKKKKTQCNGS